MFRQRGRIEGLTTPGRRLSRRARTREGRRRARGCRRHTGSRCCRGSRRRLLLLLLQVGMIEPNGVGIHASQKALDDAKLDHPPDIDRVRVERERLDPLGERVPRSQLRVVREQGRKGNEGRIPCHLHVAPVRQFAGNQECVWENRPADDEDSRSPEKT